MDNKRIRKFKALDSVQEEPAQESNHFSIEDHMDKYEDGDESGSPLLEKDQGYGTELPKLATLNEDIQFIENSDPKNFFSKPRPYKSTKIVNSLTSPKSVLSQFYDRRRHCLDTEKIKQRKLQQFLKANQNYHISNLVS